MAISRDVGLRRAFLRQSLADAEESRLLLSHGRIAAALVSCQHAIKKALKAALCIEVGEHGFQLRHNMSIELWKSQKLKLSYKEMNRLQDIEALLPLGGAVGKTRLHTSLFFSSSTRPNIHSRLSSPCDVSFSSPSRAIPCTL